MNNMKTLFTLKRLYSYLHAEKRITAEYNVKIIINQ